MGIFKFGYDKPGSGISKDEPRKKGVSLFFEILLREFINLLKVNLLFCACMLPSVVLFIIGLFGYIPYYAFALSLIAALPIGGAICATMFCLTRMLCDDPLFLWYEFRRKFKENVKQTAILGIITTGFIYAQTYLWVSVIFYDVKIGLLSALLDIASIFVYSMIAPYVFIQASYIELTMLQIVKNSVLIAVANMRRSIFGALSGSVVWVAYIVFLPVSLLFIPLVLLIGFSFSWLLNLMWIWPTVDKQFGIEEKLRLKRS